MHAIVDGEQVKLGPRQTEILVELCKTPQAWCATRQLKTEPDGGQRPDEVLKRMPESLKRLLRTERGSGVMLDVPKEQVRVTDQ